MHPTILPEIDIMEGFYHRKTKTRFVGFTLHYGTDYQDNAHVDGTNINNNADLSDDFHYYSLKWTKNFLKWYVDGYLVKVKKDNVPQYPVYIILVEGMTDVNNIDLTKLPTGVIIEYVRVWK